MTLLDMLVRSLKGTGSKESAGRAQLERDLARIAEDMPEVRWLAVASDGGTLRARYRCEGQVEESTVTTMSMAVLALGGRISRELRTGELDYTAIAGTGGMTLVLALGTRDALAVGLDRNAAVADVLTRLRPAAGALLRTLQARQSGE